MGEGQGAGRAHGGHTWRRPRRRPRLRDSPCRGSRRRGTGRAPGTRRRSWRGPGTRRRGVTGPPSPQPRPSRPPALASPLSSDRTAAARPTPAAAHGPGGQGPRRGRPGPDVGPCWVAGGTPSPLHSVRAACGLRPKRPGAGSLGCSQAANEEGLGARGPNTPTAHSGAGTGQRQDPWSPERRPHSHAAPGLCASKRGVARGCPEGASAAVPRGPEAGTSPRKPQGEVGRARPAPN